MAVNTRISHIATASPDGLPRGWHMVRFGQMAESITDRVEKPAEAGVERYVGLEHLDPDSLRIRRWGVPEDVSATKLMFKPGDIIFGRRRAYQRKLAVADFEGICSAHALVLRAKEDVIVKEYLPVFMQSEVFFDRALAISVGSLSPTINWKTLANQEFPLPPKEEQGRIAHILWAADEATTSVSMSIDRADQLKRVLLTDLTNKSPFSNGYKDTKLGMLPAHWDVSTVGDLVSSCQYGLSLRATSTGTYPIIGMINIQSGRILDSSRAFVDLSNDEFKTYQLVPGDILFNRTNSADLVGKVGIYKLNGEHVFASYLIRLRANEALVRPDYLNCYLNSSGGQARLRAYATPGVSQTNINASNLKKVLVPLPPIDEQDRINSVLEDLELKTDRLVQHQERLTHLKKVLFQELLVQ